MTHKKHGGNDFWAFLAGGALGASLAAQPQPRVTNITYHQPYAAKNDIALPANRVDHAESVLAYLDNYQNDLMKQRRENNEHRSSLNAKAGRRGFVLAMVPMWARPVFPEVQEIITLLNNKSVWTVESLKDFSTGLARELFASAHRGFSLIAPEGLPHLARDVEERISRTKQEILLAISTHNEWVKNENSKISIINMFRKDIFQKSFKSRSIRIPTLREIEGRLRSLGIETWDDLHSAERTLHGEVFSEIESDPDYHKIKTTIDRNSSCDSDFQLKLYKRHRVKPPEWLTQDKKNFWNFW